MTTITPTPSTKGKEKAKNESNIGGLLMDLAEDGSENGTSTHTEKDASMLPPAPTEKHAGTIPPKPTLKDTCKIPPAPTEKEDGKTLSASTSKETSTTPVQSNDLKQQGTPQPNRPSTPGGESSSSDDDDTEDEEYVCCLLEWHSVDPDCKRMLDDVTNVVAHHERKIGNKAVPIFQQAVNQIPEVMTEAQAQNTAAVYMMCVAIDWFHTWLGNNSYFARGQRKRRADRDCCKRKEVQKKWESWCFSFRVMVFLWVFGFPLGLWFFLWVYVWVFPLGLCLCCSFESTFVFFPINSTSVAFLWGYGILVFFPVCIYGYTEEERCASHTGPGISCGRKIHFSPPPTLSLAEDWAIAGGRRYRVYGDRLGDRGVRRYRGSAEGWSYREFIFGRLWGR